MRSTPLIVEMHSDCPQVPSQDGEAAAAELEYAVKKLGFVGCLINGFVNDANSPWDNLYLDSPKLRPFWKKVSELEGASAHDDRDP